MILRTDLLNERIDEKSDKYLLLFPNKQLREWYKRYLQRDDIIYLTIGEIERHGLVGLRYKTYDVIDGPVMKDSINKLYPIIKK